MHVGKLLARLNPKNVRFDVGSGGIPELTSTDIAAALGMIPAGIGRDLLCVVWWPDSRLRIQPQLVEKLNAMILTEWNKRESAMLDGMLAVATATSTDRNALMRGQHLYAAAHSNRWPAVNVVDKDIRKPMDTYSHLALAVLKELSGPKLCGDCGGHGEVTAFARKITCNRCSGRGHVAHGNTERAEALKVSESNYRKTWDRPYVWLLDYCSEELRVAAHRMETAAA